MAATVLQTLLKSKGPYPCTIPSSPFPKTHFPPFHTHLPNRSPRTETQSDSNFNPTPRKKKPNPMDHKNDKDSTLTDVVLQIVLVLVMAFSFLFMHDVPKKLFAKLRLRNRADIQANHHFVRGAQLLARARASPSRSSASSLAKQAQDEARRAIALDPTDAAAHLLNAFALDLRGLRAAALEALDAALSPEAARSLGDGERADALLKRAELRMAGPGQRGRVDPAIADLEESVRLSPKNARVFCLLGECFEGKRMKQEARKAYLEALKLEPQLRAAQEGVRRLGS